MVVRLVTQEQRAAAFALNRVAGNFGIGAGATVAGFIVAAAPQLSTFQLLYFFDAVTSDFCAWQPHLANQAYIAFDDYTKTFPGMIDGIDLIVDDYGLAPIEVHGGRLAVTCRR